MRMGILNSDLGIAVIDGIEDIGDIQIEKIEEQMPDGANLKDLAFFYMKDRDWIVINKGNKLFDIYAGIIQSYLELSAESRKEAYNKATNSTIKAGLCVLNDVILHRNMIYKKV